MSTYVRMVLFLFAFSLFGWVVTAQANNGLTTSSQQFAKQSYAYIAHGRYNGRYHRRYTNYRYRPKARVRVYYEHKRSYGHKRYYGNKRYYGHNYRYRINNRRFNHHFNRHYYPSRYYRNNYYFRPGYNHKPYYYRGNRHRGVTITIPLSQRTQHWKAASFGKVPSGAQSLAYRYGNAIYGCRVKHGDLTHQGQLVLGNTCAYDCHGKTRNASYYDVLM